MLNEHDLAEARSEISGLSIVDLGLANPEPEALARIPDSVAREHYVIPMSVDETGLTVAVADQPSSELMTLLTQTAATTIRPVLAPLSEIRRAIDGNYRAIGELDHLVQAFEAVEETRKRPATSGPELSADDAPVVQVVRRILTQAMRDRFSDVHIEQSEIGVRVRYRIDGALKEVLTLPSSMGVGLVSRIKIMAGMNIVERRRPQDADPAFDPLDHRHEALCR